MNKASSGSATTNTNPSRVGEPSKQPFWLAKPLVPELALRVFSPDIERRMNDSGRLDRLMDEKGKVDSRALVLVIRGINSEPNPNVRLDYAKAGKAILLRGSDDSLEERLKDALVRSFSSCLDAGDMHLRLEGILAYAVHAAKGDDISDYICKLVKRLDFNFPIESSAVVCAISLYASQGKTQALHALDAINGCKNEQAVLAIAQICRMTIANDPAQKSHDEGIEGSIKRLSCDIAADSITAFTELHDYANQSVARAKEVLGLIKDMKTDDPLVGELVIVCHDIIDSDVKNPKTGGG